jgi:hypothetical protein
MARIPFPTHSFIGKSFILFFASVICNTDITVLWRAVYAPGDGQTSLAYSSQSVQCLYINHLLSVNKLVLSYLLLRLLPRW